MNHLIEGDTQPVELKLSEKDVILQGAEVGGFVVAVMASAAKPLNVSSKELGDTAVQDNTGFDDKL